MPAETPVFVLPDRLVAKRDAALIAADERHLADIAASIRASIADLSVQLDTTRREPARSGQQAVQRDVEVRRLSARLRTLGRYGLDLCLGRMVPADGGDAVYVGRIGLADDQGRSLLVDWRSPAAEPFFGATHAEPMGLASRRRYRWTLGRITDYWDEVFTPEWLESAAALDDQSAFIASLGASRSPRMRDVLGTVQADQDAIIRAGSRGALVVDGGPGTGKTVVALHRTAYLLYSDVRLARGRVLFIGPSTGYLAYVSDVLPSLGEDGVQIAALSDLVPEGATAAPETESAVARLKADARLVTAVEAAVAAYEQPPTDPLTVETDWLDVTVDAATWATAFDAADRTLQHNDARDQVWDELLTILTEQADDEEVPTALVRGALQRDEGLRAHFTRAWPVLDPAGVVADLWLAPGYLRRYAPWLTDEDTALLQRADARAWTVSDLPLLDAARQRIGDPEAPARRRRHEAEVAAERDGRNRVVDDLIASREFDDGEGVLVMLRGEDIQNTLVDEAALPTVDPDLLAGPFAHIVVDEAQELTDAEWRMLTRRCPSRSFTIVGDRAQARHGFRESWHERLTRVGLHRVAVAPLTVNYRTPAEVMAEAEPVIRAAIPDANVPTSIRSGGPVLHGRTADLAGILDDWLATHADGTACVIGAPAFLATPRVRSLTPALSKGLEFDLVILVDPDAIGTDLTASVDRYVAMTRATNRLAILTT